MTKIIKWNRMFYSILFVVIILIAATPAVSAYTADLVSPASGTVLHSGDVISVQIAGLAVDDVFNYRISSSDLKTQVSSVTSTINMPFGFKDGTSSTSLTTTGVTNVRTTITRSSDGTDLIMVGSPSTSAKNIVKDTYTVLIAGTNMETNIGIDYSVQGTVSAPVTNPYILSFALPNVDSGTLIINIPGSTPSFSRTFTITTISPIPTYDPTGGGGGPSGPSGPSGPAAPAAPQAQLAPPGVSATSVTVQHNEQGQTLAAYNIQTDPAAGFTSAVDISLGTTVLSATGQPVSEISVTPLDPAIVPDVTVTQGGVFSFSGLAVECQPTGAQFKGGSVILSFSLTPAQWAEALGKVNGNTAGMTIQSYDVLTKSWVSVPTTVDPVTHTVSAQVTHFSTYALLYKVAKDASTAPQTYGSMITPAVTTTGAAPVPAKTMQTVPAKTMQAPPSTTKSPGFSGIAVIGVVGFVGLYALRKKQ